MTRDDEQPGEGVQKVDAKVEGEGKISEKRTKYSIHSTKKK